VTQVFVRAWLAVIGVLTLILIVEWLPAGAPPAPVIAPPRIAAGAHAGTRMAARETAAWVDAILARPLFSIGRRPPKIAAAHNASTQQDIPRLSGIMIAAGFKRAIFAPDGGGKPLVLTEGAPLADTSIRAIQPGQVTLASGEVLHPAYDKNRVPTAPAPYIPPGLPNPGFANPGFANPAFQPPGFQPPNFQPPNFQPPNFQPPNFQPQAASGDGAETPPQPGPPPFRGMMPQRRE
jgi:hypothetical protein